jgi:hypothetical protein
MFGTIGDLLAERRSHVAAVYADGWRAGEVVLLRLSQVGNFDQDDPRSHLQDAGGHPYEADGGVFVRAALCDQDFNDHRTAYGSGGKSDPPCHRPVMKALEIPRRLG